MTAGYGPQDAGPGGPTYGSGDEGGRPGPLPPRMEPPRSPVAGWPAPPPPAAPSPGHPPVGGYPTPNPVTPPATPTVPAPRATWSPAPEAGARTPYPGTGQVPGGYHPADPRTWPAGAQPGVPAQPPPAVGPPYPGTPLPGEPVPARPRSAWPTRVALLLVGVLVLVTGVQAYQIRQLENRLADTRENVANGQDGDGVRLDGLEQRAEALEKQAGTVFNPEAIAAAVLPSVFRVKAGQFTGTAFAVGKPTSDGGANLFTNYHVVESVWESGDRQVFLERTDQRFPATIVKVDEENDVAHLRTNAKFAGLVTAPTPVKSGQQIVVVGAPLGLTDSVTTGVVSAFRKAENGSGDVIQFDAPINPGNSGGPVINGSKQVVGIATAKARDAEGIGLAVPIKVACDGFRIC